MTGPTEAVENPKHNLAEETYEDRDAFCDWLYWEQYDLPTRAGEVARRVQKCFLGFHVLRTRSSDAWRYLIAKRGWLVDADELMAVWAEWKVAHDE